jgi:hypothetical protein
VHERALAEALASAPQLTVDTAADGHHEVVRPLVRMPSTPVRRARFAELQTLIAALALPQVDWDVSQGPLPTARPLTELGLSSLRLTRLISAVRLQVCSALSMGSVLKHRVVSVDTLAAAVLDHERKQSAVPAAATVRTGVASVAGAAASEARSSASETRAADYAAADTDDNSAAFRPREGSRAGDAYFAAAQCIVFAIRVALAGWLLAVWRQKAEDVRISLSVADDAYLQQTAILMLCSILLIALVFFASALLALLMVVCFKVLQPLPSSSVQRFDESDPECIRYQMGALFVLICFFCCG